MCVYYRIFERHGLAFSKTINTIRVAEEKSVDRGGGRAAGELRRSKNAINRVRDTHRTRETVGARSCMWHDDSGQSMWCDTRRRQRTRTHTRTHWHTVYGGDSGRVNQPAYAYVYIYIYIRVISFPTVPYMRQNSEMSHRERQN